VHPRPRHTMLDIGAGGGRCTLEFAHKVQSITAIEPSDLFYLLKQRTSRYPNVNCLRQSFESFDSSNLFDVVICSGVLVYLKNQEVADSFLAKATRCLRKGGHLILREPVARRVRYLLNWAYTTDEIHFENTFRNCEYWEIIRPERHYVQICENSGATKIASFPSHAPFFYHITLPNHSHTVRLKNFLIKHVTLQNLTKINLYNKLLRRPYGLLRHLMNLRTMKIMIFKRP